MTLAVVSVMNNVSGTAAMSVQPAGGVQWVITGAGSEQMAASVSFDLQDTSYVASVFYGPTNSGSGMAGMACRPLLDNTNYGRILNGGSTSNCGVTGLVLPGTFTVKAVSANVNNGATANVQPAGAEVWMITAFSGNSTNAWLSLYDGTYQAAVVSSPNNASPGLNGIVARPCISNSKYARFVNSSGSAQYMMARGALLP